VSRPVAFTEMEEKYAQFLSHLPPVLPFPKIVPPPLTWEAPEPPQHFGADLETATWEDPEDLKLTLGSYRLLGRYCWEATPEGPKYGKYLQGTKEFWFIWAHRTTEYEIPRDSDGNPLKLSYYQHFAIHQKQIMLQACAVLTDERCYSRGEPLNFAHTRLMYQKFLDKLVRKPLREAFETKLALLGITVPATHPYPMIMYPSEEATSSNTPEGRAMQWPQAEREAGSTIKVCVDTPCAMHPCPCQRGGRCIPRGLTPQRSTEQGRSSSRPLQQVRSAPRGVSQTDRGPQTVQGFAHPSRASLSCMHHAFPLPLHRPVPHYPP